jgi:hypothetical protein
MMVWNIWCEGGQIGPNPIEEFLNSCDEDFSVEDILTRITLPNDAQLARTCDIIVVNPSAPINATTPTPTTNPTETLATAPATTPQLLP